MIALTAVHESIEATQLLRYLRFLHHFMTTSTYLSSSQHNIPSFQVKCNVKPSYYGIAYFSSHPSAQLHLEVIEIIHRRVEYLASHHFLK